MENSDAKRFKEEYESLNNATTSSGKEYLDLEISASNIIKYSTIDEIIDIIENGTGVIYLGYPECPWCRNTVPALLEAADSTPLETIYYLNMHDIRDAYIIDANGNPSKSYEGNSQYSSLLESLDIILDDYILEDEKGNKVSVGEKRIYVPLVVFVKDGIIVDYQDETVPTNEDPYIPLTEEEKNELINIYKEKISKISAATCNSNEERC